MKSICACIIDTVLDCTKKRSKLFKEKNVLSCLKMCIKCTLLFYTRIKTFSCGGFVLIILFLYTFSPCSVSLNADIPISNVTTKQVQHCFTLYNFCIEYTQRNEQKEEKTGKWHKGNYHECNNVHNKLTRRERENKALKKIGIMAKWHVYIF